MPTVAGQTTTWNVFHYTDLNALINIIHKDCIILRATNVLYQNDPHEIVEGVNIVPHFGIVQTANPGCLHYF